MLLTIDILYHNTKNKKKKLQEASSLLYEGDCLDFIKLLPPEPIFNLIITSPPYNIGKSYEKDYQMPLKEYLVWQEKVIKTLYPYLVENGSICWQVGNFVENGEIVPLDIELSYIFKNLNMPLRNRIIWTYGHGLHSKKRFSGRYEVIMWYTKTNNYVFNLDDIRVPAKYPGKRAYKGPQKGQLSGNPLGKNPSDVWDIPNVKGNHIEKTVHPCQFPVALIERVVKALTNENDLVFDPFCGVSSTGVAALLHNRRYWGCDIIREYINISYHRLSDVENGCAAYRPLDKPVYDPRNSTLSKIPEEWLSLEVKKSDNK